jgi:hypothetical protein
MVDPIFAAIEAHKAAHAAYAAAIQAIRPDDFGRKEAYDRAGAVKAAADNLLKVKPITLAGVAALLRYAYEFERTGNDFPAGYDEGDLEWCGDWGVAWSVYMHRNLANALEKLAVVELRVF